ncbi:MAG: 30S ribosomal protein S17 [Omnitrophica WOR_2 bacterium RIFCSPLOWO2_02_FULL_63_16]|nr:MAG: 30S ribosomal protein S17 [Omnitrophica WOR_2 bacterium GWA2_63_20]OGX16765.1 MAG: 30S ribosomal protein S17 [Omnitrophica WOR_2 bacterium GWF2_63_9]OGX32191.1 MAG: 30S ribosomal protein S17 [Omnitrophica WOR_2 bacterium RIFCSPHIGHO2_12_FULL_64_13]OGX36677.1 MAG: 30S ribosomal protein S17 [Omnitrophica WOR_2 bacterium RIFCSPHIGHO2_02_FULL_63_39]OGX45021.1 MAG: 30S ribosomal protein S17 [Omnitrophica WOR_2 bacterium RIFCSPLOWO2_02_FULL_63_16]OGX49989.1 MAG: 30S ribosomal protein S17 [Om
MTHSTTPTMSQAAAPAPARGSRKIRLGTVVSNRMQKTVVVQVGRQVQHQKYQRVVRRTTNFKVHDEANRAKIGDYVKIMETRPLSKDKRWRLIEVIRSAQQSVEPVQPVEGPAGR